MMMLTSPIRGSESRWQRRHKHENSIHEVGPAQEQLSPKMPEYPGHVPGSHSLATLADDDRIAGHLSMAFQSRLVVFSDGEALQ